MLTQHSLEQIHRSKTGKVSDKWSSYLPVYQALFGPLAGAPLRLLEIGVQNGGSLETWAEFFPGAAAIVGCDIDARCAGLRYADARIEVLVGDINSQPVFERLRAARFDVIIDDGSHHSADVLSAFCNYFPLLTPGGIFVVEDTHSLYSPDCGGGILNQGGALYFFKLLTDLVNHQFWSGELRIETLFATFFPKSRVPDFLAAGWVDAVEFRNSMIVVRKALAPGHEKLGERLIAGTQAGVASLGS